MSNKNLVSLVSFILLLGKWIVLLLNEWQKNQGSTNCILRIIYVLNEASNIREIISIFSIHTESF